MDMDFGLFSFCIICEFVMENIGLWLSIVSKCHLKPFVPTCEPKFDTF